jgi:2-oxo-3-hexenedioate decarboxylase
MDRPIWGYMYAHTVQAARDGLAVQALSHMVSPRIEPEIAFRLSAPLPRGCRDPAEILACVEWVARAFEIVDCHYADWRFRGPDSVIDFSHHAALILGEPRTVAPASIRSMVGALRSCQVTLSCDGALIASGTGANALDHPALALALLADVVAGQHDAELLAVGEIITTGTLTDPQPAARGQTWETHTEGLELPPLAVRLE